MKIYVREGQFFADGFALRRAFIVEEGARYFISYLSDRGCGCGEVRLSDGRLSVSGETIGVIEWSGCLELYPRPHPFGITSEHFSDLTCGDKTYRVYCHCGGRSEVTVEDALRWEPCLPIFAPEITMLSGQRAPILDLRARCEEGEYILLAALEEGGGRVLLERSGEKITCLENEVTVEKTLPDRRLRRITERCVWRGSFFECSRKIVCTREHSFIREEMGRLLIEAVIAKDEESIRSLLSPDISDVRAIEEYFGEIRAPRDPLFPSSPTAVAALKPNGKNLRAVLYDFDFDEEGKISNIRCEE